MTPLPVRKQRSELSSGHLLGALSMEELHELRVMTWRRKALALLCQHSACCIHPGHGDTPITRARNRPQLLPADSS